jgi:RNA polymerase sigma-70 factor (ECF subfamily)
MATNLCLNLLRNKKHVLPLCDNGKIVNNNNEFEQLEAKIVMDAIFLTESESIRAICFMYYADGMTLKEIGETIGLSISGVRKRIMEFNKRALKKLNKENTL